MTWFYFGRIKNVRILRGFAPSVGSPEGGTGTKSPRFDGLTAPLAGDASEYPKG
jgi:hypothetical protein